MDETQTSNSSQPIQIEPRNVFGLRTNVVGNIHFTQKQEVIYPVAGVLAIHDYTTDKQKFLRFPEISQPEIIVLSPNRKFLAIAERSDHSYVNIYDLQTLKKKKTLTLPADIPCQDVGNICFIHDSKGIAVLSKEPDAFLTIFYFDKSETVLTGRVSNRNQKGNAKFLSCNPSDTGLVVIGGDYTFKLLNRTEKGFTLMGNVKSEDLIVTSLVWLTSDIIVAGTSDTELLFIEGGEAKATYSAKEIEIVDLAKIPETEEIDIPATPAAIDFIESLKKSKERLDVLCLTSFSKGFAYSIHNVVYVFEKESNFRYLKKTVITIPMDIYVNSLYKITNIAINQQMDTIIASTVHSQIYIGMLFVPETLQIRELEFKTLGEPLHIAGITGMSICSWKPIIMTCSKDQTIRVWNYETGKIELVKKYQVDVTVIGLHPSGIFVAVGFSDQLRLMEILLDDLKITKTFNFPKCTDAIFSHQGHSLAVCYESLISIISVFSFQVMRTLKGHNGLVLSLVWSSDDKYLISSGVDGAVYEWEVETGNRINEVIQKGTEYRSLAIANDRSAIYSVTNTGLLREMCNSEILREFKLPNYLPLTSIVLSRSDQIMFIASEKGHLFNVQMPFIESGGGTCTNYRFFHSSITKIKITHDDTLLATASSDGTLVIWTILNNEGKIAPMDPELGKCVDVMIPRKDLIEKIETIDSLELRIAQQIAEFQYQMRQGDAFHSEQIRDIHTGYCDAIEDLKRKIDKMAAQHTDEFNIITADIAKTNEDHDRVLLDLRAEFHEQIIKEYEKSAGVKKKMDEMREEYEVKLRKSAGCLQDTIEALETDFKKQLNERQELIRQLMKEMDDKKIEFVEYSQHVEVDNDRNMVETKLQYEKSLKDEQDRSIKWRGEAGVLRKKFQSITQKCETLTDEIENLQAEHENYQKKIQGFQKDIEDLKKEIKDRDVTLQNKEKQVNELQKKNQELEKYKQVLQHKIDELKVQIEPRERVIKEKKDQIADMENELESLQKCNSQLELQLSELKDKYHGNEIELKAEKIRSRSSRSCVSRICGDIHEVSGLLQKQEKLKDGVKNLYHKYADDQELKKTLELDSDVKSEFGRQRIYMERVTSGTKIKVESSNETGNYGKLLKQNVGLVTECNTLRAELKESNKHAGNMESLLGISTRNMTTSVAKAKLDKALTNVDELKEKHSKQCMKMEEVIEALSVENQILKKEVLEIKSFL